MFNAHADIRPWGYKSFFSCSTQLSMKFHLVIKKKIPTVKTCFMLNSAEHAQLSWAWKKFQYFVSFFKIYNQNKFHAQLNWARKKFYNLGARLHIRAITSTDLDHRCSTFCLNWLYEKAPECIWWIRMCPFIKWIHTSKGYFVIKALTALVSRLSKCKPEWGPLDCFIYLFASCNLSKQCSSWLNASFWGVWSGYALFANVQVYVLQIPSLL